VTDPALIGGEVGAIIAAVIAALYGTDKVIGRYRRRNNNGNGANGNYVTKEFCKERSDNMKASLADIKKSIASLHGKVDDLKHHGN